MLPHLEIDGGRCTRLPEDAYNHTREGRHSQKSKTKTTQSSGGGETERPFKRRLQSLSLIPSQLSHAPFRVMRLPRTFAQAALDEGGDSGLHV